MLLPRSASQKQLRNLLARGTLLWEVLGVLDGRVRRLLLTSVRRSAHGAGGSKAGQQGGMRQ